MDGFEEKKWFVYLGDHHEGPFSLADIRGMMSSGQLSATSYVWAEGMSDWKVMAEVTAFQSILSAVSPAPELAEVASSVIPEEPSVPTGPLKVLSAAHAPAPAPAPVVQQEIVLEKQPEIKFQSSQQLNGVAGLQFNVPSGAVDKNMPHKKRGGLLKYVLMLFLLITGIVSYYQAQDSENPMVKQTLEELQPLLLKAAEIVPPLAKWVSPIPALEDVSPEEYAELRSAAMVNLAEAGPRIALARSTSDPTAPTFYVTSNLPDGAVIELFIEGVAETLLNQLTFSSRTQVVITQKFSKSVAVKFPDGRAIPRGQYTIYAIEGERQPAAIQQILAKLQPATAKVAPSVTKGFKLLATREYFLGGNKDAIYQARLKEYHDKLREKAQLELGELKQFAATLESNFQSTQSKYAAISKHKSPSIRKKQWSDFHMQWKPFADQFTQFFSSKPASVLLSDFFYGSAYQAVDQVFHAVQDVHNVQNNFLNGQGDKNSIDIQLGQVTAVASGSLAALKAKIDQLEKLQPGPDGLPRKDGL